LDFFTFFGYYSLGCSTDSGLVPTSGASGATSSPYSSLDESSTSKGFLMVLRWNFFCSSFSALKPPLTVLMWAKSPLNFFLASKGVILGSLAFCSSLGAYGAGYLLATALTGGTYCYYFYDCSEAD